MRVINNIFQIREGDRVQICEDDNWTDLGKISNARVAALDLHKKNFILCGKPARVVRYC